MGQFLLWVQGLPKPFSQEGGVPQSGHSHQEGGAHWPALLRPLFLAEIQPLARPVILSTRVWRLPSRLTPDFPILGPLGYPGLKWALGATTMSILPSLPRMLLLVRLVLLLQPILPVSLLIRVMRLLQLSSELIHRLLLPQWLRTHRTE